MANENPKNATVAVTGIVSKIPEGLEVTIDSELVGAIVYGLVSEDGVEISNGRSTTQITAWQNSAIVRDISTSAIATYKMSFLENTKAVRELYYGSLEDADGTTFWNAGDMANGRFVVDIFDSARDGEDPVHVRHLIEVGQVTEVDSQSATSTAPLMFGVTISARITTLGGKTYNAKIMTNNPHETIAEPVTPAVARTSSVVEEPSETE